MRHGDNQFADIVRWALYAMIEAEEYGITSKNVDEMLKSENPTIKRILGVTPGMGKALGVDEKWVYNIVKQVGNYGESFDRNVGMGIAAQDRARPEQAVDPGRPAVRPADPLGPVLPIRSRRPQGRRFSFALLPVAAAQRTLRPGEMKLGASMRGTIVAAAAGLAAVMLGQWRLGRPGIGRRQGARAARLRHLACCLLARREARLGLGQ